LRRWPLERYAELATELDGLGYRVVLTGNRADGWVRGAFRNVAALDLIGATDLPALAALLRHCALVIGHDSGPLHLARLVGVPVVVLLGPTPPTMFFREEHNVTVMWPGRALSCAPCYNGYEFAECGDNVCMQMIGVESVLQCARRVLDAPREASAA
jgi:ADP-heptose:LPS heptosyltransferase